MPSRKRRTNRRRPSKIEHQARSLRIEHLEDRCMLAATITVNATADSNVRDALLTLREAILINNRSLPIASLTVQEQAQVVGTTTASDTDAIRFNIPGAGLQTISPASALPNITDPVVIDGYTQPGASPNSNGPSLALNTVLKVELAGNLAGAGVDGLLLSAGSSGSTIRGLAINRFSRIGIRIDSSSGNTIAGNFIGTNATGTAAAANSEDGVYIISSASNAIGGVTAAAANLISGNAFGGVSIINTLSTGNVVQGNRIGTDAAGVVDLGNGYTGVLSYQGSGTIVGGTTPGAGNLISGNNLHGVWMLSGANNAVIQGNTIGTNLAGTSALGNSANGILIEGAINAQIGGATPGAGNLISSNALYGIFLDDNSNDTVVKGNLIGTSRTGSQPLGNASDGIRVEFNSRAIIGGLAVGDGNVIAKNSGSAININGGSGHMILGNKIGTDASGALNLGNGFGVTLASVRDCVLNQNTIAFNGSGITLNGNTFGDPETGNLFTQNSIYANASTVAIDLISPTFGVIGPNFPQDADDSDTGANNTQNFPIITSVTNLSAVTRVQGTLTSGLNSSYRLEFFASGAPTSSGFGPGQTFLDDLDLIIGAGSNTVNFQVDLPALPLGQAYVTATATDITNPGSGPRNNTSEFSPAVPINTVFTVTSTANQGGGTLREALTAANFVAGANAISFNIPASDPRHFYYRNDGVAGQVSLANVTTTTATNDAGIPTAGPNAIDPDWAHSWYSIELESQLFINDQTVIDAYTQPGASANTNAVGQGLNSILRIEINGEHATAMPALAGLVNINASNTTLRGLAVNRSVRQQIQLQSGTNNKLEGNYIGTDVSGMRAYPLGFNSFPPTFAGVGVKDNPSIPISGNFIGGLTAAARNLLSGTSAGVAFFDSAPNNVIQGNLIGTDRTGTKAIANGVGVWLETVGTTVGGATVSAGNVISGNELGMEISDFFDNSGNNIVQNNRIGTDATGIVGLGNGRGIQILGDKNQILDNTVAFNGSNLNGGVEGILLSVLATGNLISRNSIYSNFGIGIALGGGGHVPNDVPPASNPPDQDTGANDLQNFPVLTAANSVGGGTQVQGTLTSTPNSTFRIEFFANLVRDDRVTLSYPERPFEYGQGKTYLGFVDVTSNSSGVAAFSATVAATPTNEQFITATATDITNPGSGPRNNTSPFSAIYPLGGPSTIVTKTGEIGVGTLREAIVVMSLSAVPATVTFNIPANDARHFYYQNDGVAGHLSPANITTTTASNDATIGNIDPDWAHSWFSIKLDHSLPTIADQALIDGYSQAGSSRNTLPAPGPLNTVIKIEIDGTNVASDGLNFDSGAELSVIEGLAINRFGDNGIRMDNFGGSRLYGNFIGTDVSGTVDLGNTSNGILLRGDAIDRVGGTSPAMRNLISGNGSRGITQRDWGGSLIQGNLIGTDRTASNPLVNTGGGILIDWAGFMTVGGTSTSAANVIRTNGTSGIDVIDHAFPPLNLPEISITQLEQFRNAANQLYQSREQFFATNEPAYALSVFLAAQDLAELFQEQGIAELYPQANAFLGNRVFVDGTLGTALGIDLIANGVTPNDPQDADGGPNNLRNFPTLSTAVTSGGSTTIQGSLNSIPNATFRIEFFSNGHFLASGYGPGETLIGSTEVTTNGSGNVPINFATSAIPIGNFITATATYLFDLDQNASTPMTPLETSEFSASIVVAPAGLLIGDYNHNAVVDSADYVLWRKTLGTPVAAFGGADGSGNGVVDSGDYLMWRGRFGAPPSAGAIALLESSTTEPHLGSVTYQTLATIEPTAIPHSSPLDAVTTSQLATPIESSLLRRLASLPRISNTSARTSSTATNNLLLLLANDRIGNAKQNELRTNADFENSITDCQNSESATPHDEVLAAAIETL